MCKTFVWLALAVASLGSAASAAPLNLILQPKPDIFSAFIQVDYDAGTQAFSAIGTSFTINDPNTVLLGTFQLLAQIDNSGNLVSGTLDITDSSNVSVLTGSAYAFGFSALEPFEFLFKVTGGSMSSLFGGSVGVIMNQTGVSATDFSADFSGNGGGVSDTAPTPEPASIVMLASALGLVAARRFVRN